MNPERIEDLAQIYLAVMEKRVSVSTWSKIISEPANIELMPIILAIQIGFQYGARFMHDKIPHGDHFAHKEKIETP